MTSLPCLLTQVRACTLCTAHLPNERGSLTQTVQAWQNHWPSVLPLPHPSPRNNLWLRRNPWFERDLLPMLRARVAEVLAE